MDALQLRPVGAMPHSTHKTGRRPCRTEQPNCMTLKATQPPDFIVTHPPVPATMLPPATSQSHFNSLLATTKTEETVLSPPPNIATPRNTGDHLGVVIGGTFYDVRNRWAKYQDVCRNSVFHSCTFGQRCYRFHLLESHIPREHLDIIRYHPETIRVSTAEAHRATAENTALSLDVPLDDDTPDSHQPVVKLPPRTQHPISPHNLTDSRTDKITRGIISTPNPASVSLITHPHAPTPNPLPTTKPSPVPRHQNFTPPLGQSSYAANPQTAHPSVQQAHGPLEHNTKPVPPPSTTQAPNQRPVKSSNHHHTIGGHSKSKPLDEEVAPFSGGPLTFEKFYAGIQTDLETGFWGWRAENDSWDDTGQSSISTDSSNESITDQTSSSSDAELPEAPLLRHRGHSAEVEEFEDGASGNHGRFGGSRVCFQWLRTGRCAYGFSCKYPHVKPPSHDHNSQTFLPARSAPLTHPLPAQPIRPLPDHGFNTGKARDDEPPVCKDWIQGLCNRGVHCKLVHLTPPGLSSPSHPVAASTTGSSTSHYSSRSVASAPSAISSASGSHRSSFSACSTSRTVTTTYAANAASWNVRVLDHTKLLIGPGFVVEGLTTGFETPFVLFEGIPSNVSPAFLERTLTDYGRVMEIRPIGKKHRVRFGNAKEAQGVISELNGAMLFDHKISARLHYQTADPRSVNGAFTDTALFITWEVPGKIAYGGYNTEAQSKRAIAQAIAQGFNAVPHEGLPAVGYYTVRFTGVPIDADKEWMSRFGPIDDVMWEDAKYTDIEQALRAIRSRLTMDGDVIDFELLPPSHGMHRAIASFLSPDQAKAACARLHGWRPASIGKTKILAFHRQEVCYTIPSAAYPKIADDIAALKQSITNGVGQRVRLFIVHKGPPGLSTHPVRIRLSGDELKDLVQFKTEFEQILRGEIVKENGRLMWDGFFASKAGSEFIRDMELSYPGVSIEVDFVRRAVILWGSAGKREPVRQKILDKARTLRATQVFSIDVPAEQLPGLCRSPDIHKLQDELGPDNFWLELISSRVMVRGNTKVYHLAKEAVRRTHERRMLAKRNQPFSIVACPACFDEVTLPITLRCGHAWCRECLSNYLLAAANGISFPLTCFGNEGKCSEPIPLGIARECLPTHDFEALIRACYFSYVHSRPKEFFYCPTPDCQEIYRTAARGTVLQCPSCLQRICPFCHVEYHEGALCPERDDDDKLLIKWMRDHDVKNCPGCRVPIERGEGCNHITCIRCQTHICWVCLETFPKGAGIYEHMRTMHGGIGLRADGL